MTFLRPCGECGVPGIISEEYLWLDNGDIVQKRDQRDRIIFTESENLDPLFRGIEELIGSSIEHIVIGCVRRTYRTFCKLFLPGNVSEKVWNGQLDVRSIHESFIKLSVPMGVGRFASVDMRCEGDDDDFNTVSVSEPYSLLMCAACHCGAVEAILGRDQGIRYCEIGPDLYHLTAFPSPHPRELKGRLRMERYTHSKGDIELERCSNCGGPKGLSGYKWFLDRGIIVDQSSRRRMTIMGPNQIDPIFQELESELGETIPRVVVEAQRRFTRTGFYAMGDYADVDEFRTGLALRGLGNLKELEIKRSGLRMRLDNAVLHLMIVGMMQGIFDAALQVESSVDWELSDEGRLELEVKPMQLKHLVESPELS